MDTFTRQLLVLFVYFDLSTIGSVLHTDSPITISNVGKI
jgi:hypothetical protein